MLTQLREQLHACHGIAGRRGRLSGRRSCPRSGHTVLDFGDIYDIGDSGTFRYISRTDSMGILIGVFADVAIAGSLPRKLMRHNCKRG